MEELTSVQILTRKPMLMVSPCFEAKRKQARLHSEDATAVVLSYIQSHQYTQTLMSLAHDTQSTMGSQPGVPDACETHCLLPGFAASRIDDEDYIPACRESLHPMGLWSSGMTSS
jgi:hypothetical protein